MNYNEALDYIHGTHKFGWKLGLKNITALLDLMGNPHKKLKYIHVAGTNGKGSTVALISSILIESGYKTGMYTSPYLEKFIERMRINGCEIAEDELAKITAFVREKVEKMVEIGLNHPTEFEIVTAIAFQYYYENRCDFVVLEVGLGGRFDSTNVIDTPLAAIITTINYDHMQHLGSTLPEIAYEKAGIIKKDGDVILYPQPENVEEVFRKACVERGARLHRVDFDSIRMVEFDSNGQVFNYNDYNALKITLLGEHQIKNAVVALKTCELLKSKGYGITRDSIRQGLAKARWPGRLEVLGKNPYFIIDAAHNAECAKALSEALHKYFPDKRKIFILGVLKDKDYKSMVEAVIPLSNMFITVTPESGRALSASELANFLKPYCKNVLISDTMEEAVAMSLNAASQDDVICAFGSLYYIGEIRKIMIKQSGYYSNVFAAKSVKDNSFC